MAPIRAIEACTLVCNVRAEYVISLGSPPEPDVGKIIAGASQSRPLSCAIGESRPSGRSTTMSFRPATIAGSNVASQSSVVTPARAINARLRSGGLPGSSSRKGRPAKAQANQAATTSIPIVCSSATGPSSGVAAAICAASPPTRRVKSANRTTVPRSITAGASGHAAATSARVAARVRATVPWSGGTNADACHIAGWAPDCVAGPVMAVPPVLGVGLRTADQCLQTGAGLF